MNGSHPDSTSLESLTKRVESEVQQGKQGVVRKLIDEHPKLADDEELTIELIYREYLAIEERSSCDRSAFLELYPRWRTRLERVFEIHDVMHETSLGTPAATRTSADRSRRAESEFQLERYEVLEKLGQGSVGTVYRARCRQLERIVALKVIQTDVDPATVRRFFREAETIARLQHPNIVQIHDVHEGEDVACLALEFVDGGNLADQLESGHFEQRAAAELMLTVARAVETAHRAGVIHRDLKPANILLTREGAPKLADFGLAKQMESATLQQTQSGAILGTPAYMSPEQARGDVQQTGPATDVHAMGAILYELLAGKQPFQGQSVYDLLQQITSCEVIPPSRSRPGISSDLETICLKCLQKDPPARYPTAQALAEDLARYLAGDTIVARRSSLLQTGWKWCRRQPVVTSLSIALLILVFLGIYARLATHRDQRDVTQAGRQGTTPRVPAAMAEIEQPQNNEHSVEDAETQRLTNLRERAKRTYEVLHDAQLSDRLDTDSLKLAKEAAFVWVPLINQPAMSNEDLIRAADTLCLAAVALRISGQWRTALITLKAGLKATAKVVDPAEQPVIERLECELLIELGKIYQNLNRGADALPCFTQTVTLSSEMLERYDAFAYDRLLWGQALLGQAGIWREDGRIADAKKAAELVHAKCVLSNDSVRNQTTKVHRRWIRDLSARRSLSPRPAAYADWLSLQLRNCLLQTQEERALCATYEEKRELALKRVEDFHEFRLASDDTTTSRRLLFPEGRNERIAAQICLTFGELAQAKQHYAESIRLFDSCGPTPNDYELQNALMRSHHQLGLLNQMDGNSESAIKHFQTAADMLSGLIRSFLEQRRDHRRANFEVNLALSKLYDAKGNTAGQLKACTAVRAELFGQPFQSEATRLDTLFNFTRDIVILRAIARESDALSPSSSILADSLVKQRPESVESWNCKAAVSYNRGDFPQAVTAANKALALAENDLQTQLWLAMSLWKSGNRNAARTRLLNVTAEIAKLRPTSQSGRVAQMASQLIKDF